jgi:hypothetical protein
MERLDRVAAFFGAMTCVLGGIPALFIAMYLGLLFGGAHGDPTYVIFEFLDRFVFSLGALLALPGFAVCLLVLLFSDASRLKVLYIAFAIASVATVMSERRSDHSPRPGRLLLLLIPPIARYGARTWQMRSE